jgi:hypothetical protein
MRVKWGGGSCAVVPGGRVDGTKKLPMKQIFWWGMIFCSQKTSNILNQIYSKFDRCDFYKFIVCARHGQCNYLPLEPKNLVTPLYRIHINVILVSFPCKIITAITQHMTRMKWYPWRMSIVKIGNSMIIHGNAATRVAILRVVQVGTVLNSASTGTSEYFAY